MLAILDRFARLGLPLEATELSIDVTDEALQADYLRDVMTALFSHPAVSGITLWGFWEGIHGAPAPALYRKDWTPKPAAEALEDLLLKRWRTEVAGTADGRGEFRVRGFLGDYELRAEAAGASVASPIRIPKDGASVTLQLAPVPRTDSRSDSR